LDLPTHIDYKTRKLFLGKLSDLLAANGEVVREEFSKSQLGKSSGWPKNLDMLLDMLLDIKELEKELLGVFIVHSEYKDIIWMKAITIRGKPLSCEYLQEKTVCKGRV